MIMHGYRILHCGEVGRSDARCRLLAESFPLIPDPETRHLVAYRGLVVFTSQLALFPTFSIVSSHLDEIGGGALMSASAASIGLLGLCLAAFLMERLKSTTHMYT